MNIREAETSDLDQLSKLFDSYRMFYGKESNIDIEILDNFVYQCIFEIDDVVAKLNQAMLENRSDEDAKKQSDYVMATYNPEKIFDKHLELIRSL